MLASLLITLKGLRVKGNKNLVLGNHDVDAKFFSPYFSKVCGFARYKGAWLSHAPIHPEELRGKINIHGHTHYHCILDDSRYINVCCEQVNFRPVNLNELLTIKV